MKYRNTIWFFLLMAIGRWLGGPLEGAQLPAGPQTGRAPVREVPPAFRASPMNEQSIPDPQLAFTNTVSAARGQPVFSPNTLIQRTNPLVLNPTSTTGVPESTLQPAGAKSSASSVSNSIPQQRLPANSVSMDALDNRHKLAIGDRLSFRIEEDQEEPRAIVVTDSGDLEVPYIGRFPAENKTCQQLARELKAELEKDYYYHATVILAVDSMTRSRGRIYIVGPVRVPGAQEIPSDEVLTLSKAIMRAGGFGEYADKQNVKITRKGDPGGLTNQTFIVNVANVLEKGKTEFDMTLEPGDIVVVPERLIRF
jgi:polysaccharide biosynthesis/export protein